MRGDTAGRTDIHFSIMDSRRDFLKKAALLAAGGGVAGAFPASIQRALAIDPVPGSTYLDAEHVVILMQENRSFDHCYGTLRGVRGFNDPRAVTLPDGNPVWLQSNQSGETYAPFRLNIQDTKATWMNSLPHGWVDQTDARNEGKHDRWLDTKRSGTKAYENLPLTLGFHNREDIPFYYALADAFTVCDQNFCSSLTGTTPNRLYLWSGTIRDQPSLLSKANVRNEDADYATAVSWKTFPERLEEHGVSWKVYQNELSLPTDLTSEAESWLANFGDNPLEYITQYQVRYLATFRRQLAAREQALVGELAKLEAEPAAEAVKKKITAARHDLETVRTDRAKWTEENFAKLSPREQSLHRRAFVTNAGDPNYHEMTTLTYQDDGTERKMRVPKGDLFHQFREDVRTGKLPTVSWLVAPEQFSDHPSSPWYGAWYLSEALDILTQNPEVWKKTIFILCYDENDGYFDHVPPFVAPHPARPETGKASAGIDTSIEQVRIEQEQERQRQYPNSAGRAGPIGLGYRVPLVIASPWSRGGYACSQVFDHTSVLQLLEKIVSHKTKRDIRETNISAWRRTVCGDLTAAFRPYHGQKIDLPVPVKRDPFLASIHQAQFKQMPGGFKKLTVEDAALARRDPKSAPWLPRQEPGTRPACALPYELSVGAELSADRQALAVRFGAGKTIFGARAAGGAFHVYVPGPSQLGGQGSTRAYAVSPGDALADTWSLGEFRERNYHLCVHGPNGFFREFRGSADDPRLQIQLEPARVKNALTGALLVRLTNRDNSRALTIVLEDLSYGAAPRSITLEKAGSNRATVEVTLELSRSFGWHDLRVRVGSAPDFAHRFAGRVETGREGFSDPLMGRVAV